MNLVLDKRLRSASTSGAPAQGGTARRVSGPGDRLTHPSKAGLGLLPLDLMLLGTLVFAAFTYGATEPWSQQIVAVMAALMAVYAAFWLWMKKQASRVSWPLAVSVAGFAVLVVIQTVPLPQGLVAWIAPGVHATRSASLADLPPSTAWVTLSLVPAATLRQLWTLLPVIVVFTVVSQCYRGGSGVRRVCVILGLAAAAAIATSIQQNIENLGEAGKAFGGAVHEHAYSGPFLHHGPFSQFVALGFGASLAVMLDAVLRVAHSDNTRLGQRVLLVIQAGVGLLVMGLGVLVVWLSGARMGIVSITLSIAAVVGLTWILAQRSRHGSIPSRFRRGAVGYGVAFVVLGTGAVAVVFLLLGINVDRPLGRWSLFMQPMRVIGDRFEVLNSLLPAFVDHPVFGSGLGTFEYVFAGYDRPAQPRSLLVRYANNEYAHLMLETGLIGLMFIGLWLVAVLGTAWGLIARGPASVKPMTVGLGVGLLAIVLYSFADFGQHVPAVALMTATAAGGIVGLGAARHASPLCSLARVFRPNIVLRGGLVGGLFLLLGAGAAVAATQFERPKQARQAFAQGQAIERQIYHPKLQPATSLETDREMIRWYDRAAQLDPAVPGYAYRRDYFTWGLMVADDRGERAPLDAVAIDGNEATRLLERVNQTRRQAPTFGPAVALASDIAGTGLRQPEHAGALSRLARDLAPNDPGVAMVHARNLGRWASDRQTFVAELERMIELAPFFLHEALSLCVEELQDYQTARGLAADSPHHLAVLRRWLIQADTRSTEIEALDEAIE